MNCETDETSTTAITAKKPRSKRVLKDWTAVRNLGPDVFEGVNHGLLREHAKKILQSFEAEVRHEDTTGFFTKGCSALQGNERFYIEHYCAAKDRHGCNFGCKVVVDAQEKTATLYTTGVHDHGSLIINHNQPLKKSKTGDWGIPMQHRQFVDEQIKLRRTALEIQRSMRNKSFVPLPSQTQLENYMSRKKKQLHSELKEETLADFVNWCTNNQWKADLNDDDVFVMPGAILPEAVQWETPPSDVRIVVSLSTKALLRNAILQQDSSLPSTVCLDGTYNLLANGKPTLILGTLDWWHQFRCIGVVYSSHEDASAYKSSIYSINEGIKLCFPGRELKADITLQDGALAIYNAVQETLKPRVAVNCWFHVTQALLKRKYEFKTPDKYQLFRSDVDLLHMSQSAEEFHHGASLFVKKWTPIEPALTKWFDKEYFGWRQNWYACCTPAGVPVSNSPLEHGNKMLKDLGTRRRQLTTGTFLRAFTEELKHQSSPEEMSSDHPSCFQLEYNEWRNAQEWLQHMVPAYVLGNKQRNLFHVPTSQFLLKHSNSVSVDFLKQKLTARNKKTTPLKHETFDEYTCRRFSFWELKAIERSSVLSDFILFTCSCVVYSKFGNCKHSLGLSILEKKFPIPAKFSLSAMGAKGKRGRKKGTAKSCYGLPKNDT